MKTVRHNTSESHSNHVREQIESRLESDALARAIVLRYTSFDPDAGTFVKPFGVDDDQDTVTWAANWGFEKTPGGYHWRAAGLFDLTGFPSAPPNRSELTRPRFRDTFDQIQVEAWGNSIMGRRGDPLHCGAQLRQLRIMAEFLVARGSLDASFGFRLVAALGNCRLFQVTLHDADDFTLSVPSATLAARGAIASATELEGATQGLPRSGEGGLEQLEARMELWATSQALEEAFEAASSDAGADVGELDRLLKTLRRWIGRVDGNMQRHMTSLRPAAGTYLLTNWRRLLAPCHREVPPWWLDGCIG